jgi:hypothetical protein
LCSALKSRVIERLDHGHLHTRLYCRGPEIDMSRQGFEPGPRRGL